MKKNSINFFPICFWKYSLYFRYIVARFKICKHLCCLKCGVIIECRILFVFPPFHPHDPKKGNNSLNTSDILCLGKISENSKQVKFCSWWDYNKSKRSGMIILVSNLNLPFFHLWKIAHSPGTALSFDSKGT